MLSVPKSVWCLLLILDAVIPPATAQSPAADPPASPAAVYANALLDSIFDSRRRYPAPEEEPTFEGKAKALIDLGEAGWDETFKRLARGQFHWHVFPAVLGRSSLSEIEPERTRRLLALLNSKNFALRGSVPRLIAAREPLEGNKLLRPFLSDSDAQVREASIAALSPLVAAPSEIEIGIDLLDDLSEPLRAQARYFLERATGHIPDGDPASSDMKAIWSQWWQDHKTTDLATLRKTELNRCANLLTSPDPEFRERVGMALIAHSRQVNFGFHQKNVWWDVHRGEISRKNWLEWLRLRYSGREHVRSTVVEDEFRINHPEVPLDALRATITMNVRDLESEESRVRSLARQSLSMLLEESCPFRESCSDAEGDWLNAGIRHWWAQRLKALQNESVTP